MKGLYHSFPIARRSVSADESPDTKYRNGAASETLKSPGKLETCSTGPRNVDGTIYKFHKKKVQFSQTYDSRKHFAIERGFLTRLGDSLRLRW
jgi:hypothetical protein